MNMNEDIRLTIKDALEMALSYHQNNRDCGDGSFGTYMEIAFAREALSWLDAQPTERWEPVTDMPYTQTQSTVDGTIGIYYEDGVIGIGSGGAFLASPLPDGYALCRRVEVTP